MTGSPDLADEEVSPLSDLPYAARVGISFMEVNAEGDDFALYDKLSSALQNDSRIEWTKAPSQEEHAFDRPSFASADLDGDNEEKGAPDPATHVHAFGFREPILFEVRVPRRLQPHFDDFDHIPASSYWAAWDGIALVVLWQLEDFQASGQSSRELGIDEVLDALTLRVG